MTDFNFGLESIQAINVDGPKRFEYVNNITAWSYIEQRRQFKIEFGHPLPRYEELCKFGRLNDLRILTRKLNIFIKFQDSSWLDFSFKPGFITDLASVPPWFRGVIDNDTSNMLEAVLIHDFLFSTHGLPFQYANELFYNILIYRNYSPFKAKIAKFVVNSIFGRKYWKLNKTKRNKWTRETAMMWMPRPLLIDKVRYNTIATPL